VGEVVDKLIGTWMAAARHRSFELLAAAWKDLD